VPRWQTETTAPRSSSSLAAAAPARAPRPTTVTRLPAHSMP
jgi:hypothetical protein